MYVHFIMRVHESDLLLMRGSGIGSFFSNVFRGLIPIAQKLFSVGKAAATSTTGRQILKVARKNAIDAGLGIANDALKGENLKQAAVKNLKRSGKKMFSDVVGDLKKRRSKGGMMCAPAGKKRRVVRRRRGMPTKRKGTRKGKKGGVKKRRGGVKKTKSVKRKSAKISTSAWFKT